MPTNPQSRNADGQRKAQFRRGRKPRSQRPSPAPATSVFDEVATTAVNSAPFDELGLPDELVKVLANQGLTEAFPIQAATVPDSLNGRDVLGRGQTGSGKTLAFGLSLLAQVHNESARPLHPRALVLVPTRELAMQVTDALVPLAKAQGRFVRPAVGGTSFVKQADQLRRGVDLLVATPGRLSDHVRQGTCVLSEVAITAVDEADQMSDMGFLPQVRELLDLVPSDGQRLLFSATLDRDVDQLVHQYLNDPVVHSLAPSSASVDTMEHHQLMVSGEDKNDVVTRIAAREGRTILFVRTKHGADRLSKKLREVGVRAGALHGGKAQNARTRILDEFRENDNGVLVATNVAARGIHVDDVSLVVHVDPPADSKDYLHRAGRTARAGAAGSVITVVTPDQRRAVKHMTRDAGVQPTITDVTPTATELVELTGAREPSGEPVVDDPAPRAPQRKRPGARGAPANRERSGRRDERARGGKPPRGEGAHDRGRAARDDRGAREHRERRTDRPEHSDRGERGGGFRENRADRRGALPQNRGGRQSDVGNRRGGARDGRGGFREQRGDRGGRDGRGGRENRGFRNDKGPKPERGFREERAQGGNRARKDRPPRPERRERAEQGRPGRRNRT